MDVLADVLATGRVKGSVFCRSELAAPWGMHFASASRAGFHVVAQGECWLETDGPAGQWHLNQGDVVLLPSGVGHRLTSERGGQAIEFDELKSQHKQSCESDLTLEGDGARTVLLCGSYRFEHQSVHPLIAALPRVIVVLADDQKVATPLQAIVRVLVDEYMNTGSGSSAVVDRLVDVLFIYIIRCWLTQPGVQQETEWLLALNDEHIGAAIAAMHAHPEHEWSIDQLANRVAMSRAAFARRFRLLVGEPPLAYLTRWRMDRAARLLRESNLSLAEIAQRVGYRSEYAFNRAFRRLRGLPPGRYREESTQILVDARLGFDSVTPVESKLAHLALSQRSSVVLSA